MNRTELTALRDVLDLLLELPASAHAQIAAWLTPEAALTPGSRSPGAGAGLGPDEASAPGKAASAKPNGHDPHPPPPRQAKVRRPESAFAAKTAERKLLSGMREAPGASVNALAKAAGANRSSTGERLRGLARAGKVTKDSAGHWRLVAELAGEAAGPTSPPSP